MPRNYRYLLPLILPVLIACNHVSSLEIGEAAGPVTLANLEGVTRTMDNYDERPGTVVVFLSARCPETERQIHEIVATHQRYRLREVVFVGVVANPAEETEEIRTFMQRRGVIFPIYRDPDGAAARHFGATTTPEFFMLDNEGKLVYHGALRGPDGATTLDGAIQTLLAKEPIATATTPVSGTPIAAPAPPREIDNPYGKLRFYSSFVFDDLPGVAVHHCSTLAEAPNGDLLCLWYGGSYESAEDQALYLARLPKGKRQWETPTRMLWNPEQPPGNAVIFRTPDNKVGVVWGRMEQSRPMRRGTGWGQCRMFYRTSDDNGITWSDDTEIPNTFGALPRNVPITLNDDRLALPVSGRTSKGSGSFLLYLSNDGTTWTQGGFAQGGSQPTIIQRDNGDLLALMRRHPRIPQVISIDGGQTWSEPATTGLKNPGSGIAMTRLQSGRVVLIFNDTEHDARYPLSILQSTDGGRSWKGQRTLEADWGEFSYPSVIQASDGTIHVSYTYRRYTMKHVAFNEDWLIHKERPN